MTVPQYARLASRVLGKESGAARPIGAAVRAEAIGAIERAIANNARRRRAKRAVATVLAVAAVAVLGAGATRLALRPRPTVVEAPSPAQATPPEVVVHSSGDGANVVGGSAVAVGSGQSLAPGARVVALPHGRALLAFSSGTQVNVEEGGDVTIVEGGTTHVLALREGALRADVAKLKTGERFVIRTSDAEVEVHGTSFRVATAVPNPACGNGTSTRVSVYEGIVTVRRGSVEDRVPPGESWPRNCADATPSATATSAVVQAGRARPRLAQREPQPAARAERPVAAGPSLVEQNDAFAKAAAAKRNGDLRGAVDAFGAFVATYPDSALAESAAAQRMKLLRDLDRRRAVTSARAYLARYPSGFAKGDAEAIVAEGP